MKKEQHGDKGTRLYTAWCNMKARCKNTNNHLYGGKGIKVCSEWDNSYIAFEEWRYRYGDGIRGKSNKADVIEKYNEKLKGYWG